MTDSPVAVFTVTRAVLDPEKPHLMWVLIQSSHPTPGDYVARLWYTLDQSNPQDWRNPMRALAHFDCAEIEGSPKDEQFTTIVTGLKANGFEFGLPFHLGANMVAVKGLDQTQMTFFVEFCHEVEDEEEDVLDSLSDEELEGTLAKIFNEASDDDCVDEWHAGDQTTACPSCAKPPF